MLYNIQDVMIPSDFCKRIVLTCAADCGVSVVVMVPDHVVNILILGLYIAFPGICAMKPNVTKSM